MTSPTPHPDEGRGTYSYPPPPPSPPTHEPSWRPGEAHADKDEFKDSYLGADEGETYEEEDESYGDEEQSDSSSGGEDEPGWR